MLIAGCRIRVPPALGHLDRQLPKQLHRGPQGACDVLVVIVGEDRGQLRHRPWITTRCQIPRPTDDARVKSVNERSQPLGPVTTRVLSAVPRSQVIVVGLPALPPPQSKLAMNCCMLKF